MTAQQLQHLAALAGDAARYYHHDHPAWARTMAAAAHIARLATAHQQRQEEAIATGAAPDQDKAALQ